MEGIAQIGTWRGNSTANAYVHMQLFFLDQKPNSVLILHFINNGVRKYRKIVFPLYFSDYCHHLASNSSQSIQPGKYIVKYGVHLHKRTSPQEPHMCAIVLIE